MKVLAFAEVVVATHPDDFVFVREFLRHIKDAKPQERVTVAATIGAWWCSVHRSKNESRMINGCDREGLQAMTDKLLPQPALGRDLEVAQLLGQLGYLLSDLTNAPEFALGGDKFTQSLFTVFSGLHYDNFVHATAQFIMLYECGELPPLVLAEFWVRINHVGVEQDDLHRRFLPLALSTTGMFTRSPPTRGSSCRTRARSSA